MAHSARRMSTASTTTAAVCARRSGTGAASDRGRHVRPVLAGVGCAPIHGEPAVAGAQALGHNDQWRVLCAAGRAPLLEAGAHVESRWLGQAQPARVQRSCRNAAFRPGCCSGLVGQATRQCPDMWARGVAARSGAVALTARPPRCSWRAGQRRRRGGGGGEAGSMCSAPRRRAQSANRSVRPAHRRSTRPLLGTG